MIDLRLDGFFPGLAVPVSSAPAAVVAFSFLLAAIFTLTLPAQTFLVQQARIGLCIVSCYWFWLFGFGYEAPGRAVESGVRTICAYGITRNFETGLAYITEPIPRWVVNGKVQPLPSTFFSSLIWSLDLLLSMRGTSYFKDTHWDFAPAALINDKHNMKRSRFLLVQTTSLIGQILLADILETIAKSRSWDPQERYPITSLPVQLQILYAIAVCMLTAIEMSIQYTALSIAAVAVGSPTSGWPPLFDDPFHATSLHDFWTRRWHASFRRVLLMTSAYVVHISAPYIPNHRARQALRGTLVFLVSYWMHLILMRHVTPPNLPKNYHPFFEPRTLQFFLSQPLGMLLEVVLVKPFAKNFLPSGFEVYCTRAWAWGWLLWSGRFWADVWVSHGLWGPTERVVGYSLLRGLLYGEWAQ